MPKISWNFSSLFSEIIKRWNNIHLRSRRPGSRMAPTQTIDNSGGNSAVLFRFLMQVFLRDGGGLNVEMLYNQDEDHPTAPQCFFCQQPCQISTYYQLDPKGRIKGWKCDRHAHTIQYLAIPDATYYAFMFTIWLDQREYSIEAYKLPQGEQWELKQGSKTILHFDYIPPNLTPDNIDGRLKTLIIFS